MAAGRFAHSCSGRAGLWAGRASLWAWWRGAGQRGAGRHAARGLLDYLEPGPARWGDVESKVAADSDSRDAIDSSQVAILSPSFFYPATTRYLPLGRVALGYLGWGAVRGGAGPGAAALARPRAAQS